MAEKPTNSADEADGGGASIAPPETAKKKSTAILKLVKPDSVKADSWTKLLNRSASGVAKPILMNVLIALRNSGVWKEAFRYNAFSLIVELVKAPPWASDALKLNWIVRPWTDHDDRLLCEWLQKRNLLVPVPICMDGVFTVAREHSYHPVQEYLGQLQWDGEKRVGKWLSAYLGAEDSVYHTAVGTRWLVSAIARIMQPGPECKADCALVLQGLQGTGKSSALQALAGKWFTDEVRKFGSKDAAMGLSGRWIVELAELSALGDVTIETVKAFLSQTMDRYRPPYGRYVTDNMRQCVFAATTNKESFLKDETGDRRWWPVKCGVLMLLELRRDRDQIWAEAMQLYNAGHVWWLDSAELRKLAEKAQADRFEEDPWEATILRWIEKKPREELTIEEVLSGALAILPEEANKSHRNRVSSVLRFHKWEKSTERGKSKAKVWRRAIDSGEAKE